ncbi:MAG: GNAT family N-acetyltransferase [Holophagaceae bacterium]|nr:GNAT family N-acetyltransferase [Holophagaceae bacterium]
MSSAVLLGPGSSVPRWVESIEESEFGSSWGNLDELEMMWVMDEYAFARWRVVPKIGEAELLRVAVSQIQRRKGIANNLLDGCIKYLTDIGCQTLRLEVRLSNHSAQRLYQSGGWRQVGHRKAYFSDGEDALLYAWP